MPDTPVKLINLGQLTTEPVVSINVPQSQRKAGPMSYYVTSAMTMLSKVGSLGQHSIQLRIGAQTGDSAGLKFYRDKVKTPLSINVRSLTPAQVAYSPDGNWIYSGGHWDNSVRGYHIPEQRTVFHRLWHSGRVTCLSVDAFGSKLITGSADHSCCIWAIEKEGTIKANPLQTLFGHSCPISGCAISTELDMAVSASGDGVTNIYTVRKGVFIRTLQATNHSISAIPAVTLSRDGYIVFPAISRDQSVSYLHLFSANGKTLAVDCVDSQIKFVAVDEDRIVTGDNLGNVEVRRLFSLEVIFSMSMGASISSLHIVSGGSLVLVGLESGQVYLLAPVR